MYMRLDMFAALLGVPPGELLHATRTNGQIGEMALPARRQGRGAAVIFDHAEATAFAERWHARTSDSTKAPSDQPLVALETAAEKVGITPRTLWQAVKTGRELLGVPPPAPEKSCNGQLLFDPVAVAQFAKLYRCALKTSK